MERTPLSDIRAGEDVLVQGWAHEIRDLANVKFIVLRDRTGMVQCVVKKDRPALFGMVPGMRNETCLSIRGKASKSAIAKAGLEIVAEEMEVLGEVSQILPVQVTEKGDINTELSTRLDNRFLDLRKPKHYAIFRVRSEMVRAMVEYFHSQGFINISTPKITCAGVESGADMFSVKYFDRTAYLSQSPQIYKQMMVAAGFERVDEITPP